MEKTDEKLKCLYEIIQGMSCEDIQGITKYALFLKSKSDKMLSFIGRKVCGKSPGRETKTGVILDISDRFFLVQTNEDVLEYVQFQGAKILSDSETQKE